MQRLSMFGTLDLPSSEFKQLLRPAPPSAEYATDSGVPSATRVPDKQIAIPASRWRVQALFTGLPEPHRCAGQSSCALVVKFHARSRKEQRLPVVASPNQE